MQKKENKKLKKVLFVTHIEIGHKKKKNWKWKYISPTFCKDINNTYEYCLINIKFEKYRIIILIIFLLPISQMLQ